MILLVLNRILLWLPSFDFIVGQMQYIRSRFWLHPHDPICSGMSEIAQSKRFPNGMLKWHRLYTFQPIWINLENLTNLKNQEFFRLQTKCKQEMFFCCFQGFFYVYYKVSFTSKIIDIRHLAKYRSRWLQKLLAA